MVDGKPYQVAVRRVLVRSAMGADGYIVLGAKAMELDGDQSRQWRPHQPLGVIKGDKEHAFATMLHPDEWYLTLTDSWQ